MINDKPKILIIEDNEDLNNMFKIAFEAKDYEVETSLNGIDGISKAAIFKPDLVLLDIMMPQMNGYDFLKALKENTSLKTIVVVNSNLEQEKDAEKAKTLGADFYIKKSENTPFETVEQIDKILQKK